MRDVCEHDNGIMKMPLSWLFSFSEAASCTEGTSSSLVGEGNHSIDSSSVVVSSLWSSDREDSPEAGDKMSVFFLQAQAHANTRSLPLVQGQLATGRSTILVELSQLVLQDLAVGLHARSSLPTQG